MKPIITHFDLAIFLIGLLGLTLMLGGIIIQTSPYRGEFSPYYPSIVPTGVFIHIVSVVYLVVGGVRRRQRIHDNEVYRLASTEDKRI